LRQSIDGIELIYQLEPVIIDETNTALPTRADEL